MSKLTMLAAFGAGYVLGAKAGRDRYEEIMAAAGKVRANPQVQRATEQATETVRTQAPVVAEKAKEAAGQATEKVKEKVDEVRDTAVHAADTAEAEVNDQPSGPPPAS